MKMKRITTLVVAYILTSAMAACGSPKEQSGQDAAQNNIQEVGVKPDDTVREINRFICSAPMGRADWLPAFRILRRFCLMGRFQKMCLTRMKRILHLRRKKSETGWENWDIRSRHISSVPVTGIINAPSAEEYEEMFQERSKQKYSEKERTA